VKLGGENTKTPIKKEERNTKWKEKGVFLVVRASSSLVKKNRKSTPRKKEALHTSGGKSRINFEATEPPPLRFWRREYEADPFYREKRGRRTASRGCEARCHWIKKCSDYF